MRKLGTIFKLGPMASLLVSCLVHVLILVFVVGPYIDVAMEREEMVLELSEETGEETSREKRKKEDVSLRLTRRVSKAVASGEQTGSGAETGELPEHVNFAPEDEATKQIPRSVEGERKEKTLQRVRRSIASVWSKADPPCPGIAELRLKLAPTGELLSIWITRLKGRSELGEYLRGLLGSAAPYKRAMLNATQAVVFDCRFEISGPRGDGNKAGSAGSLGSR